MLIQPRSRNGRRDRMILSVLMVLIGSTIVFSNNAPNKILHYVTIFDLVIIYLFVYYFIRSIERLKIILKNRVLIIKHGFTEITIPFSQVLKVERVATTNLKKIMAMEWKEHYVGYYKELKRGIIRAFLTSKDNIILIHTLNGKYAISVEDNNTFLSDINKRWDKKLALSQENNASLVSARIWNSIPGLAMIALNIFLLFIPVFIFLFIAGNSTVAMLPFFTQLPLNNEINWEMVFLFISSIVVFIYVLIKSDILSRNGIDNASVFLWIPAVFTLMLTALIVAMLI